MTLILIGIATTAVTFIGGYFALRFKDSLHLILGFSAGAVIGVAFFDLIPEAINLGKEYYQIATVTSFVALGFIIYMILDRTLHLATHDEEEGHGGHRGHLGPGSLTIHSFLDGLAIGLAFQVSMSVGAIVTIAVLVHDFSDGINTVNMSLLGHGKESYAKRWLVADAIAPLLGILSTMLFSVPEKYLSVVLAVFSGFFLYIGASDLLPESHHRHPRLWTSLMTLFGIAVLYIAVQFAKI